MDKRQQNNMFFSPLFPDFLGPSCLTISLTSYISPPLSLLVVIYGVVCAVLARGLVL